MKAGTLEIDFATNIARLVDDMSKVKSTVTGTMKDVEGAVSMAKKALGALGVGLSVGYFVSLIKGSIDAMDHLRDLSKTTDITVEALSGLRVAAKQSGGDLDSIAASINKLSVEMGKSPEKFAALGVSAKDPLKAFQQLSDVFVAIENPQQRAALAAAALGKSWAGAAPLLAEGGAKIGELVAAGTKASGVTQEMAQHADALNDKWVLLVGTGGLLNKIVGPMLPLLNVLADELLKTKDNASGANDAFTPLKDTLQVLAILYANLAFMAKTAGDEIGGRAAEAARIFALDFEGAKAIRKATIEQALQYKKDLDDFEKRIMGAGLTGKPSADKPTVKPLGQGTITGFLGGGDKDAENIGKALQAGMDEEAKVMAEAAKLSDEFRAKEREQIQAHEDWRMKVILENIDLEKAAKIKAGQEELEIAASLAALKRAQDAAELQARNTFLDNLAGLMNTKSKEMFEIGKLFALAQAAIKGAGAVMDAWAAGMSTGGPWAPVIAAAYAAAAAANALNLINNIASQKFGGGGGSAPVAPSQGASGVSPQGLGGGSIGGSDKAPGQTTIIHFDAKDDDVFSGKAMRRFLEKVEENTRDGGRVVIAQ